MSDPESGRPSPAKIFRSVAVVGAGFSGSIAAAVLAPFAEHVTVFTNREADSNDTNLFRNQHCHFLMGCGSRDLEAIAGAEFETLIRKAGLTAIDGVEDFALWVELWRVPHAPTDLRTLVGRWEDYLKLARALASRNANVRWLHARLVIAASASDRGISLTHRAVDSADDERIGQFDFVVEASGLQPKFPERLRALINVEDEAIESPVFYQSQRFRISGPPPGRVMAQATSKRSTLGCLAIVERENELMLTMSDLAKDPLVIKDDAREVFEHLESREFANFMRGCEPISKVHSYRKSDCYRRSVAPSKNPIVLFGDLRASLNPLYGEGLAMSLEMARHLREFCEAGGQDLASLDRELDQTTARWVRRTKSLGRIPAPAKSAWRSAWTVVTAGAGLVVLKFHRPSLKTIWSKLHRVKPTSWQFR